MVTTSDTVFTNHSREPSVTYSPSDCSGNAARDIQPGEELTEDYCLYEEPSYLAKLCLGYGIDLSICRCVQGDGIVAKNVKI